MRNAAQIRLAYARSASLEGNILSEIEAYWRTVLGTYQGNVSRNQVHTLKDNKLTGIFDWWFNREKDFSVCDFNRYADKMGDLIRQLLWVSVKWKSLDPETDRPMMEDLIEKADDVLQKPILPNKGADDWLKKWLVNKTNFNYYKFFDFNSPKGHHRPYPGAWDMDLSAPPAFRARKFMDDAIEKERAERKEQQIEIGWDFSTRSEKDRAHLSRNRSLKEESDFNVTGSLSIKDSMHRFLVSLIKAQMEEDPEAPQSEEALEILDKYGNMSGVHPSHYWHLFRFNKRVTLNIREIKKFYVLLSRLATFQYREPRTAIVSELAQKAAQDVMDFDTRRLSNSARLNPTLKLTIVETSWVGTWDFVLDTARDGLAPEVSPSEEASDSDLPKRRLGVDLSFKLPVRGVFTSETVNRLVGLDASVPVTVRLIAYPSDKYLYLSLHHEGLQGSEDEGSITAASFHDRGMESTFDDDMSKNQEAERKINDAVENFMLKTRTGQELLARGYEYKYDGYLPKDWPYKFQD